MIVGPLSPVFPVTPRTCEPCGPGVVFRFDGPRIAACMVEGGLCWFHGAAARVVRLPPVGLA